MLKFWIVLTAISLGSAPSVVLGHPGHGSNGGSYSVAHYFTEPVHVVATVGLVAAMATVFVVVKQLRDRIGRSLE